MTYKDILKNSIRTFEDLEKWLTGQKARVDPRLKDVIAKYPMRVNTYYLGLIEKVNDGIWKQAIPHVNELEHYMDLTADPLDEEGDIPLGGPRTIIHRYPDRVLLYVSNECAMYCRFCTRKRKVGDDRKNPFMEDINKGIDYVASHEITGQSYQAIKILRDLGIPIANQSVLLKGVNDDTDVMRDLVHGLGKMGVRPYYLYYTDLVEGTGHFRTELYKGKEICRDLCGTTTGFLRPAFVVDAQGGRGKVPVDLGYSEGISEDKKGGVLTSPVGLGKVYLNDPIEKIEGKPKRHNRN